MKLKNKKKFIYSSLIITIIFFLDRISKIYIINLSKKNLIDFGNLFGSQKGGFRGKWK